MKKNFVKMNNNQNQLSLGNFCKSGTGIRRDYARGCGRHDTKRICIPQVYDSG